MTVPMNGNFSTGNDGEYEMADLDGEDVSPRPLRHAERHGEDVHRRLSADHQERKEALEDFMLYTPEEEKQVVRTFDRRLVLFVACLYLLSFLDRSNIGNARIAGLSQDLHLSPEQYEWLLRAFYITYICFEWMTMLYRILPAHIYISLWVASWGVFGKAGHQHFEDSPLFIVLIEFVASAQALCWSFESLLVLRFALGLGESAFSPGVPFYLSFFYRRDELAYRTGLFISAAPLATSFASAFAWVITRLGPRVLHVAPWRALFLIEGFPAIVAAALAWHYIPDRPETASYLTAREREVARLRLRNGNAMDHNNHEGRRRLDWKEVHKTLLDPKNYISATMFFSCNVAFSSLPVFLPEIIKQMGHSSVTAQALAAPPYLISFVVVLLTAYFSDRWRSRGLLIAVHALFASLGYATIAVAGAYRANAGWRYAGVYPASFGFFSAVTLIITWTINNQRSESGQGTGLVMLNIIGQMGPFLGTHLYPESEGPYYVKGMSVCGGFMLFVAFLALAMRHLLVAKNARLAMEKGVEESETEGLVAGDDEKRSDSFQYML